PLAIFLPYLVIAGLYFRYIFGYFSRLFERQADMHVFALQIAPEHLTHALDHIGVVAGNIHHVANWHHYGIQERIDQLNKGAKNPAKEVAAHDRRIFSSLAVYFIVLALCGAVLASPFFDGITPFMQIAEATNALSDRFERGLTLSTRSKVVDKYVAEYHLKGD